MLTVRIVRNLKLGLNSLRAHKLRSALTTLGIVFGVASVICMLAIGEGLSYEAREQIKRLGSNNIILRSVKPPRDMQSSESARQILQYGLSYLDVERIATTVPHVQVVVPTRELRKDLWFGEQQVEGRVIGTVPWFPSIANRRVVAGRFLNPLDMRQAANVCVLSRSAARNLARLRLPLGEMLKVGTEYFRVVGVVETGIAAARGGPQTATKSQNDVYVPLTALRSRFGDLIMERQAGSWTYERVELHGAIVRVDAEADVLATARVVEALLKRFHDKQDFEMIVPLQLLREKERVKELYNIVLGLMAAISLVVGGIGIMNIMLATVSERTSEIGIRRAIGARKRDIMAQFLTETVLISIFGGMIGVLIGMAVPSLIEQEAGIKTIVTGWSVALAFGISALVGLFFGFYPALRAANMDPITALRHE